MKIPLIPDVTSGQTATLSTLDPSSPIIFIDFEPFLVELQGSLELPSHKGQQASEQLKQEMNGIHVGKMDFTVPNKPILRISHHRLEGKLMTLSEPFAILKSSLATPPDSRPSKKIRLTEASSSPIKFAEQDEHEESRRVPSIRIVGLVRKKIVFSKRPEPEI